MDLDKAPNPVAVLAIRFVCASSLQQHATLPPTAFARITAWSHGQVSTDTTSLSEWGNAAPVLLHIGAAAGAATELELSLWDKRQAGNHAEASTAVLLDAGAEVTLPALDELGDSEQEAVEMCVLLKSGDSSALHVRYQCWVACGRSLRAICQDFLG